MKRAQNLQHSEAHLTAYLMKSSLTRIKKVAAGYYKGTMGEHLLYTLLLKALCTADRGKNLRPYNSSTITTATHKFLLNLVMSNSHPLDSSGRQRLPCAFELQQMQKRCNTLKQHCCLPPFVCVNSQMPITGQCRCN